MEKLIKLSCISIVLLVIVLIGHMVVLHNEKEEKEFLDLKIESKKVTIYNIVRDILVNIFMFSLIIMGRKYLSDVELILVVLPSILVLLYYARRRMLVRLNIYVLISLIILGAIIRFLLVKEFMSFTFNIMLYILITFLIFFLITYSQLDYIGIFGVAIIAAYLCNTSKIEQFIMFILVLLLGLLFTYSHSIAYIFMFFIGLMIQVPDKKVVYILGILFVLMLGLSCISKVRIRKIQKRGKVVERPEKTEYINFDVNEKTDDFIDFNIDEISTNEDIFSKTVELKDEWFKEQ